MVLCEGKTPTSFLINHVAELCVMKKSGNYVPDHVPNHEVALFLGNQVHQIRWHLGPAVANHKFKSNWKLTSKENHRSQHQTGKFDQPKSTNICVYIIYIYIFPATSHDHHHLQCQCYQWKFTLIQPTARKSRFCGLPWWSLIVLTVGLCPLRCLGIIWIYVPTHPTREGPGFRLEKTTRIVEILWVRFGIIRIMIS